MAINWKTRLKHKAFWISIIPATILLVEAVASVFGFTLELDELGKQLVEVVNILFIVLALIGIPVDMTTEGFGDSVRALEYDEPAPVKPIGDEDGDL